MNKKTLIIATISIVFLFLSCKKQATIESNETIEKQKPIVNLKKNTETLVTGTAQMTFDTNEHDFGSIKAESVVNYTFKFKNTGKEDLVITNAQGSCGCTIPEYPKEAIKPGESGKIKVSFNSAGKSGNQQKSVTITANTEVGKELLTIKAQIN